MNITDRYADMIARAERSNVLRRYHDIEKTTYAVDILATKYAGFTQESVCDLCRYLCALHTVENHNLRIFLFFTCAEFDEFDPTIEIECLRDEKEVNIYVEDDVSILPMLTKALSPCNIIF